MTATLPSADVFRTHGMAVKHFQKYTEPEFN